MKIYIVTAAVLLSVILNCEPGICRSWGDLDEGEHEIYGSEREEKFPTKAFFVEKEAWENHYSFMLFWLYKFTDYPKYKSTRMLPFYYGRDSKIDNRSQIIIPPLLSYFETDGTAKTSFVLCPLYYSSVNKNDNAKSYESDRSVLALIWWGREKYSSGDNSYQTIFPVFYHSSEFNPENGRGNYLWINPLFVSYSEKYSEAEDGEHLWWAPVIPLTVNYSDQYSGHRNILWLVDYSWSTEGGKERIKRFWFLPFYLWERGDDGYTAVNLFYINNRHGNGDYYYHLLPLFSTWKDSDYSYESKNKFITRETLTPVSARRTVVDEKTGGELYSNFWFPIIPLFFRSSDREEGTHTNLLWLIDWESDRNGVFKNFWFAPVIFHQAGEDGYKYYIPFYCRPSGATEKEGYTFGIFHYYGWSESGSTVWSWLYYSSNELVKKPAVKGDSSPPKIEEFYYTHLIPLYWSWKSAESTGQIIFPLWYNYRDKQMNIHVDLSGFAWKTFTGPFNPDISAGIAKMDDTWYFDSDYSWLYDVVSFSSRVPVKNPFAAENDTEVKNTTQDSVKGKTGINGSMDVSRENSRSFRGGKLLFGMFAYEKADTRWRFRALPLAWFYGDENSDDELSAVFPLFFSYKSVEKKESYFVTLPYAAQRQDRSYIKAYGLILYWNEYRAETGHYEKSILWPLVNWYSSQEKSGYRILPFVWHREWEDSGERTSQTFAPLFYNRNVKDIRTGQYSLRRTMNPIYCIREENNSSISSYTMFAPLIPLYYHSAEKGRKAASAKTVTPLFYYKTEESELPSAIISGSTLWFPLFPVFYKSNYRQYNHWNLLGILDKCSDVNYSRFFLLPVYYSTEKNGERHKNILGIIDWKSTDSGVNRSMVFPVYWWSGEGESSSLVLFPLLSYFNREADSETRFTAGVYWHESPAFERLNFLYLFDHQKYIYEGFARNEYSLLFTTAEFGIDPEIIEMRLLWGSLFSYNDYRKSGGYDIDALLWLAGIERSGYYFHSRFLPLYWYSSERGATTLLVPPILSYFSRDNNGDFDLGLLGLVYYRNEDKSAGEDRRMWLLGSLYNEVKVPERKYHARGSLWGILWDYEVEDETDFKKFTILKGLYKYIDKKGKTEHTVFWIF